VIASTTAPEVSVVLPTRNRRTLLARALATVLGQENVRLEAIVVDDGSTDGTWEWLNGLRDPRVRPLRLEGVGSVAEARNVGIAAATGEWVAFLDDDDVWASGKLRKQLGVASAGDVLVYAGVVETDESLRPVVAIVTPTPEEVDQRLGATNMVGTPSAVVVRTEVLKAAGGFDQAFSILADWDLWLRLRRHGGFAVALPHLVGYTVHGRNLHLGSVHLVLDELRRLRARHPAVAAESTDYAIGSLEFLRWLASRYRKAGRRFDAGRVYLRIGLCYRRPRDIVRAGAVLLGDVFPRRDSPSGKGVADSSSWLASVPSEPMVREF
jgi:glycosyltransferase involved in cell wall biosynthesis